MSKHGSPAHADHHDCRGGLVIILAHEERDGSNQHIATLMNSYLRDTGLKKNILINRNADEEDLAEDDIDTIQELSMANHLKTSC
mgnify:CR=1 FL=1